MTHPMVQQQQVNSSHSGGRLLFVRLLLGTGAVVVKKKQPTVVAIQCNETVMEIYGGQFKLHPFDLMD